MKTKKLLLTATLLSPLCCLAETSKTAVTHPTDPETWISFLPVIFFLLILIVTTIKLKNDKTKLSDLLAEKELPVPAVGGAPAVAPGAPIAPAAAAPVTSPTSSQSVSRFIAFLTGLVALTIGICVCTFYMYSYFSSPAIKIDLSNLTNVIWGLGIGVLPYGFNKASAAMKSNT